MRFNDIHINFVCIRTVVEKYFFLLSPEKKVESEEKVYLTDFYNNGELEANYIYNCRLLK